MSISRCDQIFFEILFSIQDKMLFTYPICKISLFRKIFYIESHYYLMDEICSNIINIDLIITHMQSDASQFITHLLIDKLAKTNHFVIGCHQRKSGFEEKNIYQLYTVGAFTILSKRAPAASADTRTHLLLLIRDSANSIWGLFLIFRIDPPILCPSYGRFRHSDGSPTQYEASDTGVQN